MFSLICLEYVVVTLALAQGAFYSITKIPENLLNREIHELHYQCTCFMASGQCYWLRRFRTICFSLTWKMKSCPIVFTRLWKQHIFSLPQGWILHPNHLWASHWDPLPREAVHLVRGWAWRRWCPVMWRLSLFSPPPPFPRAWNDDDFRLSEILVYILFVYVFLVWKQYWSALSCLFSR